MSSAGVVAIESVGFQKLHLRHDPLGHDIKVPVVVRVEVGAVTHHGKESWIFDKDGKRQGFPRRHPRKGIQMYREPGATRRILPLLRLSD
jgi:hypothetical protein